MGTIENRRLVIARRGGPEVLEVVTERLPEPGPGEIRVKTMAAGVSSYDVMLRGHWFPGQKLPYTPGEDVVGLVDELGAGVTGLEVGQRVAMWTFGDAGGYAEYVVQPADRAVPVPADLPAADAVALVVNYLTASLAMHQMACVQPGERMLAPARRVESVAPWSSWVHEPGWRSTGLPRRTTTNWSSASEQYRSTIATTTSWPKSVT